METPAADSTGQIPLCYRHRDRETYIACQRCGRSICTDCMNDAAVGFQCPDCVRAGARSTRQGRTTYGGRRRGNPMATSIGLIVVNVAIWLVVVASPAQARRQLLDTMMLLPQTTTFLFPGGFAETVRGIAPSGGLTGGGAFWQLVTSMFAHEQILHIAFNMLALYVLGPQVEHVLGRARFLALYFVAGLTGSALVFLAAQPSSQTLGASGAIFGLMGALLVIAIKQGSDWSQLAMWVGINLVITFTLPSVSWQGHIGGFLGGIAVGAALVYAPRERRTMWQTVGVAMWVAALVALVGARYVVLA